MALMLDPVREDAPVNATATYGASKIAAEIVLRASRHDHGLPAIAAASLRSTGRDARPMFPSGI